MNRGRKRMAVFTLILAAVFVAAAWKIGWQRDDIQTPEPGGKRMKFLRREKGMRERKCRR